MCFTLCFINVRNRLLSHYKNQWLLPFIDCYEILGPFSILEGHLFEGTYNEDFMCKGVFIAL